MAIARYNDETYGNIINKCRDEGTDFPIEIFNKVIRLIQNENYIKKFNITHITFAPSLNTNIVKNFAFKLAKYLNLNFIECFIKNANTVQSDCKNSFFQRKNVNNIYETCENLNCENLNIIIIDDIIRSGYTLGRLSFLLKKRGANNIVTLPLCSAEKSESDENDDEN